MNFDFDNLANNTQLTPLWQNLTGIFLMKAKAYQNIQKEKSFQFMYYLEYLIGETNMQKFVSSWFLYNFNLEVTNDSFKFNLYDFISSNYDIETRE
jgi:hypothetical protein